MSRIKKRIIYTNNKADENKMSYFDLENREYIEYKPYGIKRKRLFELACDYENIKMLKM